MAQSIAQFLTGIEDNRKRNLAQKAQALVPYLDYIQKQKTVDEQRGRILDMATGDAVTQARARGYNDQEIEGFTQSIKGIQDPTNISPMLNEYDKEVQARRLLTTNNVPIPPNASRDEILRLGDETYANTQANKDYAKKAELLGIEGKAAYDKLIAQGNTPATAYGEASRNQTMTDFETKQKIDLKYSKSGKGGIGGKTTAESKAEQKQKVSAKVEVVTDEDTKKKTRWVYWENQDGVLVKSQVYTGSNGKILWKDTNQEVNLDDVVDYEGADTESATAIKKMKYSSKKGTPATSKQTTNWDQYKVVK